jgi:hypothetical protein
MEKAHHLAAHLPMLTMMQLDSAGPMAFVLVAALAGEVISVLMTRLACRSLALVVLEALLWKFDWRLVKIMGQEPRLRS